MLDKGVSGRHIRNENKKFPKKCSRVAPSKGGGPLTGGIFEGGGGGGCNQENSAELEKSKFLGKSENESVGAKGQKTKAEKKNEMESKE